MSILVRPRETRGRCRGIEIYTRKRARSAQRGAFASLRGVTPSASLRACTPDQCCDLGLGRAPTLERESDFARCVSGGYRDRNEVAWCDPLRVGAKPKRTSGWLAGRVVRAVACIIRSLEQPLRRAVVQYIAVSAGLDWVAGLGCWTGLLDWPGIRPRGSAIRPDWRAGALAGW